MEMLLAIIVTLIIRVVYEHHLLVLVTRVPSSVRIVYFFIFLVVTRAILATLICSTV